MNRYFKCFDDNMTMSFLANDKDFLNKYTKLLGKIKDLIGKNLIANLFTMIITQRQK